MGADVFCEAHARVPIDLVGMDAESLGGIGEIDPPGLAAVQARYRFCFSPVRQTSLSLAVIEAMMIGLPVIGLATCELAALIENGESGVVSTALDALVDAMRRLIREPGEAARLGIGARRIARERFRIERFAHDWDVLLTDVAGRRRPRAAQLRRTPRLAEVTA
jgi:glycosyltransferase involved in cell wall biosynthesis